jgi:hypothetical protein
MVCSQPFPQIFDKSVKVILNVAAYDTAIITAIISFIVQAAKIILRLSIIKYNYKPECLSLSVTVTHFFPSILFMGKWTPVRVPPREASAFAC